MRTTRGMLVSASLVLGLGLVGCGGDDAEVEAPQDGVTEAPAIPETPGETDDGLTPTEPMDPGAPDGGTEPTDPGTIPDTGTEPDTGPDTDTDG